MIICALASMHGSEFQSKAFAFSDAPISSSCFPQSLLHIYCFHRRHVRDERIRCSQAMICISSYFCTERRIKRKRVTFTQPHPIFFLPDTFNSMIYCQSTMSRRFSFFLSFFVFLLFESDDIDTLAVNVSIHRIFSITHMISCNMIASYLFFIQWNKFIYSITKERTRRRVKRLKNWRKCEKNPKIHIVLSREHSLAAGIDSHWK